MRRRLVVACVVCLVVFVVAVAPANATGTGLFDQDLRTISYGQQTTGSVSESDGTRNNPRASANDLSGDWYYEPVTFEGTASDVVRIDLGSAGADTVLVLVAPDGDTVAINEDGGDGNDSLLVHRLAQSGEYTIQVMSHYPETSFDYSLSVDEIDVLYEPDPTTLPEENQVVGRVDDSDPQRARFSGHYENVTFQGGRNQMATIRLVAPIDSELRLFGPDGSQVGADIEDASGRNALLRAELPADGEYTVVAGSNGRPNGYDFMLTVDGVRPPTPDDGGGDDGDYSGAFAEFEMRSLSMNRSSAYHGEPVRVDARIENYGNKGGTYTGLLMLDQHRVATRELYISPGEARNMTFVVSSNETESYEVFLKSDYVGHLDVKPRPPAAVETVADGNEVHGIVTHSRANSSLSMALPASNESAEFENLTLSFAEPTPRFDVIATESDRLSTANTTNATSATNRTNASNATTTTPPPLPTGIRRASYLRVRTPNASAVDGLANASLSFSLDSTAVSGPPTSVAVYHFDADEGAKWAPVEATLVNETEGQYRYRAPVDSFSVYAVGIRRPAFEIGAVTLDETVASGGNVTASAVVRNEGALAGTFSMPLKVDNRTVQTRNVSLDPGNSTTVSFDRRFETAGTYRVSLGNRTRDLVVQSTPTAGEAAESSTTQPTTAEPAQERTDETATAASGPGFGALTTIVAGLLTLLVAAGRKRS